MSNNQRLLVVDDEPVICQACRRVFSRQGFQVEEAVDPCEGLDRASQEEYDAVLLDIKMPKMDGIQFLEQLRKTKPDLPVMIMTGYPSIPNAAAAVRLGASDYVTKPFTPEEITQAVRRMLATRRSNGKDEPRTATAVAEPEVPRTGERLFWSQSWLQLEVDGSACVGAVPTRRPDAAAGSVRLPQVGEVLYQGLPLAALVMSDGCVATVPSPVSGVVVSVNEQLKENPSLVWDDPCGQGWIACVCTTRLEEEVGNCKPRNVVLMGNDELSARLRRERLERLGCRIQVVRSFEELTPLVENEADCVVMIDAASFGDGGPGLVGRINAAAPSAKVVVLASVPGSWEAAYRERGIFYYAVEPIAEEEIVEIVDSVFRLPVPSLPQPDRGENPDEPLSGIRITNRNGHKIHLLATSGLLRHGTGLGGWIRRKLTQQAFPIVTNPGHMKITPEGVLKTAATCDRVMVLLADDVGRFTGSLVRDTKAEYISTCRENASRVTTLIVQPDAINGIAGLDERTTAVLAEHIVHEMATY